MKDYEAEGYKLLYSSESHGRGSSSVCILVRVDRPLTSEDANNGSIAANRLMQGLQLETAKQDPETETRRQQLRASFITAFVDAGFDLIYVEMMPNGYWPPAYADAAYRSPWFRVTTNMGHFLVGWRKRVIELNWKDTTLGDTNANSLFPNEDVTRECGFIHCYGEGKLVEYLKVLKAAKV